MYGTIVELLTIAFLMLIHMNGSFMIPDVMAVSTLFITAEGSENQREVAISSPAILKV